MDPFVLADTLGYVLFFRDTITEAVEVQPFVGLVTVNVYVPGIEILGLCDEEVKPEGPFQL
jgi:hypothetical protein